VFALCALLLAGASLGGGGRGGAGAPAPPPTLRYPDDADAWIEEFAVERRYRRRGIGTALLMRAFAELRTGGAERALLSTDSRGGGRHLYESVGMSVVRSSTKYMKRLGA
jgi:ribosomal protein S18 acetylase RimI-like enzyme